MTPSLQSHVFLVIGISANTHGQIHGFANEYDAERYVQNNGGNDVWLIAPLEYEKRP